MESKAIEEVEDEDVWLFDEIPLSGRNGGKDVAGQCVCVKEVEKSDC
jgi:hypothetical protein